MKLFIEVLEKNCAAFPDRPAAVTDFQDEVLTYGGLWDMSGRVYAYLKERGIGREDFVMIRLPRGVKPVAAMIGIIRAGAAFVFTESIYPEARIAYIQKDCGCILTIDEQVYAQMALCDPLSGFEATDPHDACYVVYTSGTTGNPKGVLHEYGKLSYLIESYPRELVNAGDASFERFALIVPMSFVAFVLAIVCWLYNKETLYVVSFGVSKNFRKLGELIEKESITEIFMPPSMLRFYKAPAPTLKLIITGSEPANGICYPGKPMLMNLYSSSECGFFITQFIIKKAYDRAPVGKNSLGMEIMLLKENGQKAAKGEVGEICLENPYTRGYINLPELTAAVFKGGIYHTGDLGFLDENGDLILSGRADDMIKINGNRIEPAEIEAAAKEVLGVTNVVAKGFDEGDSAFVALFCLKKEVGDALEGAGAEKLREELGKKLPPYMTPSYIIALDEMPLNANGKVSRKLLPSPRKQERKRVIEPTAGETEGRICAAMAEILELDEVGPNEDFYCLGGDSIKTIRLVTELSEGGLDIEANTVYENRTARAIAAACRENTVTGEERDRAEAIARTKRFPLLHGQMQVILYGNYDPNRHYSDIGVYMKLKPDTDPKRLRKAADRVLLSHASLRTKIFQNSAGEYRQCFEESFTALTLEIAAEEAEVPDTVKRLYERYAGLRGPLYVSALISTESGFYYALVISHVIADGGSQKILLSQIRKAYADNTYMPPKDYYFSILENRLKKQAETEDESAAYYQEILGASTLSGLKPDAQSSDRTGEILYLPDVLDAKEELDTGTFMTACALALAEYNGEKSVAVAGAYHGRGDVWQLQTAGYLMQDTFVRVSVDEDRKPREILRDVKEQLFRNRILDSSLVLSKKNTDISPMVKLIYQDHYQAGGELNALGENAKVIPGSGIANGLLTIHILQKPEKLDLLVRYAKAVYHRESVERFLKLMLAKLNALAQDV